jgi:hypothetical protein
MPDHPAGPTRAELAREVLLHRMRQYSEDFHCAGWLGGLEFLLWDPPVEASAPWTVERKALSDECRILAEIAGGWWVYRDENRPDERGPFFIPMDRWQQILAERKPTPNP